MKITGVDVGGTFTDIVEFDEEGIRGRKVPTTPRQADGVADALGGGEDDTFLHGTTAATNALLEERGADLAWVTDAGYEDLVEIARQDRPALYDSAADRPAPLVSRKARIGFEGDREAVIRAIDGLSAEIVALGLIESYTDPVAERELASAIADATGLPVIASTDVSPEFREYERFATTLLSAYLTPSVETYLEELDRRIAMASRLLMTSSGGLIPFSAARGAAGRLILSGPAGGAVAAAALGRHQGHTTVLSFDMGGTSTDVCRITRGNLAVGSGHSIGGRVNRVPSVPVRTIGAGGGSVAWVDPGGALRVGPRSAGATPGPAAYGKGGDAPTVTDANLLAGHIPAGLKLGGSVGLDRALAEQAVARVGERAGLDPDETAAGILEIVDSHMEHALRSVSVEEGADPREAVLVAFGGAGGLHASRLASRLGIATVLIPPLSGVFSALGLLLSSPRADHARTVMLEEEDDRLSGQLAEVKAGAKARFEEIFATAPKTLGATADMRYRGQSHELEVECSARWADVRRRFEAAHQEKYGFTRRDEPIELVNLRAVAGGEAAVGWSDLPPVSAKREPREQDGAWARDSLPAGFELEGPAIITERNSAILLEEGDRAGVLEDGTLEIVK